MTNPAIDKELTKYANKLRNPNKKQYASEYYDYMTGATNIKPVYHGQSLMACQAIEHEVNKILKLLSKGDINE